MMGIPGRLLELPQERVMVERMHLVLLPRPALHLPKAHHTHHKRQIHRDFHDVTNNILA